MATLVALMGFMADASASFVGNRPGEAFVYVFFGGLFLVIAWNIEKVKRFVGE